MKKVLLILLMFILGGASIDDARKANEAFRNENYAEAIELYKKAIESNPENAKLYYNLASAFAKEGQAEDAIRYFEQYKAMTDNPEERAKADYNIGNIHTQAQKWDKAINAYKNALRYKPLDGDAKHNYELAQKQKKEQQKQNKQQNQQQNNDQKKKQQDQQQQNQNKNKNQKNQQQNNNQQNQQQNQQQQPKPTKISKADAEKILKALEQKEKDLLKKFKKQKTESSKSKNEKDW